MMKLKHKILMGFILMGANPLVAQQSNAKESIDNIVQVNCNPNEGDPADILGDLAEVSIVKNALETQLMQESGVVGVGIGHCVIDGDKTWGIRIYFKDEASEKRFIAANGDELETSTPDGSKLGSPYCTKTIGEIVIHNDNDIFLPEPIEGEDGNNKILFPRPIEGGNNGRHNGVDCNQQDYSLTDMEKAVLVKDAYVDELLDDEGVVGVGVGFCELASGERKIGIHVLWSDKELMGDADLVELSTQQANGTGVTVAVCHKYVGIISIDR